MSERGYYMDSWISFTFLKPTEPDQRIREGLEFGKDREDPMRGGVEIWEKTGKDRMGYRVKLGMGYGSIPRLDFYFVFKKLDVKAVVV